MGPYDNAKVVVAFMLEPLGLSILKKSVKNPILKL